MHVGQVSNSSHSANSRIDPLFFSKFYHFFFFSNGRGTCYGDSGGPAIVKQPDGSYVQVLHFVLDIMNMSR